MDLCNQAIGVVWETIYLSRDRYKFSDAALLPSGVGSGEAIPASLLSEGKQEGVGGNSCAGRDVSVVAKRGTSKANPSINGSLRRHFYTPVRWLLEKDGAGKSTQ